MSRVAETLMVTTKCSAGCAHCPFSVPGVPALHLPSAAAFTYFKNTTAPLVVLSGGEPFEHPEIAAILKYLSTATTPFRIATGGHVDLRPFLAFLKGAGFEGISLGTDVLSARSAGALIAAWRANATLLKEAGIPFSVTVTLGDDLGDSVGSALAELGTGPQFTYLRYPRGWEARAKEWGEQYGRGALLFDLI